MAQERPLAETYPQQSDALDCPLGNSRCRASGRFFAWVIGGALPTAPGADWLTPAWDQNAYNYVTRPAAAVVEECEPQTACGHYGRIGSASDSAEIPACRGSPIRVSGQARIMR